MNINCNGVKTLVKDTVVELPDTDATGYSVVETCRVINQWLYGTSLKDRLSHRDYKECKSTGLLGTNLAKLLDMDNGSEVTVYKSEKYKHHGKAKSYFEIICKVVK